MNVALTEHLVCPGCGPPFGLVLLAHDVRARRVNRGEFGCPKCRHRFPVEDGFADLRPPPLRAGPGDGAVGQENAVAGETGGVNKAESADPAAAGGAATRALRLAAALGVTEGPGIIVVPDSRRDEAGALARLVRGIEVVVVGWGGRKLAAEGVSAFATGPRLPLRDGGVRGVVAGRDSGEEWWRECLRVLMPGRRIVITEATSQARDWVRSAGLATVLDDGGLLAAALPGPGAGPRMGNWMGTAE